MYIYIYKHSKSSIMCAAVCLGQVRPTSISLKQYVKSVPAFDHWLLFSASCNSMPNLHAALFDATLLL